MTHDDMVVEVPARLVAPPFPKDIVPLVVDVKLGDTWK